MNSRRPLPPISMSGRLALPLITGLRKEGKDVDAMLARLGLVESDLKSLHGRLTMETWMDLHVACVAETGDRAFPLRAVNRLDRDAFPLAFYLMGTQATLRDGYSFVHPYRAMAIDRIEFNLTVHGDVSHIDFELDGRPLGPPAFAEYLLALVLALGRLLTPDSEPPTEIVFAHRWPRHAEDPEEYFGAPVRFGGTSVRYVFPNPRIDAPIPGADPHLGQLLVRQADEWIAQHAPNERLRDRVRRFLAGKSALGDEVIAAIPPALKMSERTLRRRLQGEGTSARDLLDDVRRERALALLEEGTKSLDEIAYLVGFSGANAFRRAFKRWTGVAPSEYGGEKA